jgi:two-component system chemotaxis sensor kinase CheA
MSEDDEFLKELREGFLQESLDLLGRVEGLSLQLEKNPENLEVFEELTRLAHNLKGSGKAVGFVEIATLAHGVEDYILAIKHKSIPNVPENLSFLFHCLDTLKKSVDVLSVHPNQSLQHESLVRELENRVQNASNSGAHLTIHPENSDTKEASPVKTSRLENASFRVPKAKLDFLLEAFGEQVILQSVLDQCKDDLVSHRDLLIKTIAQMNKLTLELQNHALSLTMVNMKITFTKLERAVRDAANLCKKEVDFTCGGETTEIDKTMIEALSDPLTHMVRNAVDHGLEDPHQRVQLGKSSLGRVHVEAKRVGGQFWLEVSDDGRGLDPEKLRRKAIERGILSPEKASRMSDSESYRLIFSNGFSTKDTVSEISGRGVGMNVVEESIQRLKGQVELESRLGRGMTIRIKLPLTLAIFNGAVVRVDHTRFVIPNSDIDEISRIRSADWSSWVTTGKNRSTLRIRNELFDVIDLRRCLSRTTHPRDFDSKDVPALLTRKNGNRAYLIDEIIGVQKIVQKPLSDEIKSRRGYVAATLLGDGTPGIVLNLGDLADGYSDFLVNSRAA